MVKPGYKQSEIGVIPEDWDCVRLGEKVKIYRGGSPRPIQDYITTSSDGVNWIKIGDVGENDKYIRSTQEKITPEGISKSREVHIGDFILSNSMSFGRPYILDIDGCIHDGWLTIQDYKNTFSTEYLYYLLSSDLVYQQCIGMAAGSSVKNLNKDKVSALYVIYPAVSEQERIAEALSDVDDLIFSLEKLIEKYKSIKVTCLQQMFPQKGETTPKMRLPGFTGAWEQRKAKDLCSISTGKSNTQDRVDDGIYPFYVRSPIVEHSNRYLFDEEAVLTVGDGVGTGKVFHYVNGKYDLHQRVYRMFDFSEEITAKYFYYYFSNHFYDRVMAMTAKTSVDSVRYEMIADMDIALPKVQEQMAISDYFNRLDNLITLHQRKLNKTKKIKQGMMQQLLTGKIRLV